MPSDREVLSQNLTKALNSLNKSQSEFARDLKMSQPYLNKIVKKKVDPSLSTLAKISGGLGISISELLHQDSAPKPRVERPSISQEMRAELHEVAREAATVATHEEFPSDVIAVARRLSAIKQDQRQSLLRKVWALVEGESLARDILESSEKRRKKR